MKPGKQEHWPPLTVATHRPFPVWQRQASELRLQVGPENPDAQVQAAVPLALTLQLPPLRQGLPEHGPGATVESGTGLDPAEVGVGPPAVTTGALAGPLPETVVDATLGGTPVATLRAAEGALVAPVPPAAVPMLPVPGAGLALVPPAAVPTLPVPGATEPGAELEAAGPAVVTATDGGIDPVAGLVVATDVGLDPAAGLAVVTGPWQVGPENP